MTVTAGVSPVRAWAPLAAAVVVLTVVLVPLSPRGAPDGAASSSVAGSPPTARRTVPVEGVGYLIRAADGRIRRCSIAFGPFPGGPHTRGLGRACGGASVVVTGVDDAAVRADSGRVRVEGTYRGGVLAVARVVGPAPEEASADRPALPCGAPGGGRQRGSGRPGDDGGRAAVVGLTRARPQRYGEAWTWGTGTPDSVLVVGTTGDVTADRMLMSTYYKGSLCVHKIRYSVSDLALATRRLRAEGIPEVSVDGPRNRVRVRVVALDPPTSVALDRVGRGALIVEEPLLRWLE